MTGISIKRLADLFSDLEDAVLVADAERTIVYANPAVERVFGYAPAELVGASTTGLYATDSLRLGRERFGAQPAASAETKYRVFYRRKNGNTFASETVTSNIYDGDGTVAGFLGIIRDISDRVAVEDGAAAAATTLHDAVETLDDGFALFDAEDRLEVCNERYREIYPKSAQFIVPGTPFRQILRHGLAAGEFDTDGEPEEQWLEDRMRAHARADGTRIEQHLADGRWIQIRERRTRRGGIVGTRADITALKSAHQQIARIRRDRETLTNNMPCLIEELDREGRCVFINDVGARWLGTTGAAAARQRTGEFLDADDQATLRKHREAALAGQPSRGETQLSFPDGQRRDVVLNYIPNDDHGRQPAAGCFVFIADVTEQKQVERTLRRLHGIIASREKDCDRKLDLILEAGCAHFDLPIGVISRVSDEAYTITHSSSTDGTLGRGARYGLGQTYCAEMLTKKGPLALEHVTASPLRGRQCCDVLSFESYIGAPIEVNGALHGTIFYAGPEPKPGGFTGGDHEIIKQLADWIGNEIGRDRDLAALRRANAELERLASTDDLTGILNRREFRRRADLEFERARRYGDSLSVLVLDLDEFKEINDEEGHAAGDAVLRRFARSIASALRPTDVFGRLGGDEFAIVLGHSDAERGVAVADRLRTVARACHRFEGHEAKTTVSIGVACVQPGDGSIARAIERADRALYSAKSAGRDTTALFSADWGRDRGAGAEERAGRR